MKYRTAPVTHPYFEDLPSDHSYFDVESRGQWSKYFCPEDADWPLYSLSVDYRRSGWFVHHDAKPEMDAWWDDRAMLPTELLPEFAKMLLEAHANRVAQ